MIVKNILDRSLHWLLALVCEERCRLCDHVLGIAQEIFVNIGTDGSPALLHTLNARDGQAVFSQTLCQKCWNTLAGSPPLFGFCPLGEDENCPPLAIASGGAYSEGLRKLIHLLKFSGDRRLSRDIAALTMPAWWPLATFVKDQQAIIVPVPLHWKKRFARGFNQTDLIAAEISSCLAIPLARKALRRVRTTTAQKELTQEQRISNVSGAFAAAPSLVAGKAVVLVDDICTSGATLAECALTLKNAGALFVVALTAGRAVMRSDKARSKTTFSKLPENDV